MGRNLTHGRRRGSYPYAIRSGKAIARGARRRERLGYETTSDDWDLAFKIVMCALAVPVVLIVGLFVLAALV